MLIVCLLCCCCCCCRDIFEQSLVNVPPEDTAEFYLKYAKVKIRPHTLLLWIEQRIFVDGRVVWFPTARHGSV